MGAAIGPWGFRWSDNQGEKIARFAEFGAFVAGIDFGCIGGAVGLALLKELGESPEASERAKRIYRERDEIMVRDMARHRGDSKMSVSAAQEAHRSLDELMRSETTSVHDSAPETGAENDGV